MYCKEKEVKWLWRAQEVLRCLHSHLGSRAAKQASTALEALLLLLEADTTALLSYAAFLTGMLEYLQHFSPDQVHQAWSPQQTLSTLRILHTLANAKCVMV